MNEGTNLQRLSKALESNWLSKSNGRRRSTPSLDFDISVRELSAQMRRAGQDLPMQVIPPFDLYVEYRASSGISYVDLLPTRILHQVDLSPELMQLGLELAVPLLAHSAKFDGQISLSSEKIHVPLDAPLDANGKLTLSLHQVRSEPTYPAILQALDFVAGLRNREPSHEFVFVDGAQVEVELANQRVSHRGLQVGLPRVDPRLQITTTGSVGIADRTLDLIVGIPVPVEYLARREQVRELGVPNLHLVVLGTLDQPVVQWSSLRKESGALLSTIGGLLGSDSPSTSAFLSTLGNITEGQTDETIAAGVDVLKNFLESRRKRLQPSDADILPEGDPSANNEANAEAKPTSRPILDALRQRLRGRSN